MRPDPSPEILARNLERLGAPPALARQLQDLLDASDRPVQVALDLPPGQSSGQPSGQSSGQPPRLTFAGQDLHHPEAPVQQAAGEVGAFLANRRPHLVVFFGLGLGLHARFIEQQTDAPVLIYEPRLDVLAEVLPRLPLELERAVLITNPGHLVEAAAQHLSAVRHDLAAGAIPAYRQLFPAEFDAFREALNQALKRIQINQSTRDSFAVNWAEHLRLNLPALVQSPPLAALPPVFRDRPGILVGAGPSLDRNMEVLARARDRALVCAVHTAAQPLARLGIVPHILTMLEGHQLDYFFEGVTGRDQTYLAVDPQTHPCHLQLGYKGLLPLNQDGRTSSDWLEKAAGLRPLPAGGSVACAALTILHHLGCNPIILVGMDAAFTDGRTHSQHAETGCCRIQFDREQNLITFNYLDGRRGEGQWEAMEVEAWGGRGMVPTRPVYSSFRYWFEAAGQTWAGDRTLINATEGGARFQGFREMTLAEAVDRHCPDHLDAAAVLDQAVQATPLPDPAALGRAILEEMDQVKAAAEAALQIERTGTRVLKLFRDRKLGQVQPLLDRLAVAEKELQGRTLQTRLINSLVGHKIMAISQQKAPADDPVSRTVHSVELSLQIARLVKQAAGDIRENFEPLAEGIMGS